MTTLTPNQKLVVAGVAVAVLLGFGVYLGKNPQLMGGTAPKTQQPPGYPQGTPPPGYPQAAQPQGYPPAAQPQGYPPPAQQPQGYPPPAQQPQGYPPPAQQPQGYPPAQQPTRGGNLVSFANERTDYGVPPQTTLQQNVGSPTPTTIPGGGVIPTTDLKELLDQRAPLVLIDAWNDGGRGHATIPGANQIPWAGVPGSFDDQNQGFLSQALQTLTRKNMGAPVVFFCQGASCWEAYNAALRAIKLGYTQVIWYRGGLPAWQQAGYPIKDPQIK